MNTNIVRAGRLVGRGECVAVVSLSFPVAHLSRPLSDELGNTYYEALPGHGPAERKRWVEGSYYFDASEVRDDAILSFPLLTFFFFQGVAAMASVAALSDG